MGNGTCHPPREDGGGEPAGASTRRPESLAPRAGVGRREYTVSLGGVWPEALCPDFPPPGGWEPQPVNTLETEWSRHGHDEPQSRGPQDAPSGAGAPTEHGSGCVGATGGRSWKDDSLLLDLPQRVPTTEPTRRRGAPLEDVCPAGVLTSKAGASQVEPASGLRISSRHHGLSKERVSNVVVLLQVLFLTKPGQSSDTFP